MARLEATPFRLGVIGGSGLYQLPGLRNQNWIEVDTPWGKPSDALLRGELGAIEVIFLPRHGRGHRLLPSELNYRANLYALKQLGVTDILSISACGSFREELAPGTFVIVDQFIDRTQGRLRSFFGDGVVAHVSAAEPTCSRLGEAVSRAAQAVTIPHKTGGTYLCIEGPQFSTRAESSLYRSWGADVVGMTNLPEAYLAREAEICYQTIAMVTDYDSWRSTEVAVEAHEVLRVLHHNAEQARILLDQFVNDRTSTRPKCSSHCDHALDTALLTAVADWPAQTQTRLKHIIERYLKDNP